MYKLNLFQSYVKKLEIQESQKPRKVRIRTANVNEV